MSRSVEVTISKKFEFCASHQLVHLAESQPGHQCARLHGHNYVLCVHLAGPIHPDTGMIRDYADLSGIKAYIDSTLDHRHLNEVRDDPSGYWTTAENLAVWLLGVFRQMVPEIVAVEVCETPKTSAVARLAAEHTS